MPKIPLTSQTVCMLSDGYVGKILDDALSRVSKDLEDRGQDGKPRTLVLKLTFRGDGSEMVEIRAEASTKIPSMVPPKTIARMSAIAGGMMFNPEVSDNPDQMTFTEQQQDNS